MDDKHIIFSEPRSELLAPTEWEPSVPHPATDQGVHTRNRTSFVPQFLIDPQDVPSSGFPQQPSGPSYALPSQPHLPGATPIFVLLLSHVYLLPQPMSYFIEFKLTCFVFRAPFIKFSSSNASPVLSFACSITLTFPTLAHNSSI